MIAAVLADAMQGVIRAVIDASDRCVFCFKAITHLTMPRHAVDEVLQAAEEVRRSPNVSPLHS